jgi:general secretion pathway protein K
LRIGIAAFFARRRAVALMLVIWAIIFMAMTVTGVIAYVQSSLRERGQAATDFYALLRAESGIAVAMNPTMMTSFTMVRTTSSSGASDVAATDEAAIANAPSGFQVRKMREGVAFPINTITDDRSREALAALFVLWGVDATEATIAAESLADWIDRDEEVRAQGAERDYYEGVLRYDYPANRNFSTLDELVLVRGFGPVARANPKWRDAFGIYGTGVIDLAYASKDIIMAVTGAQDADVQRLLIQRAGPDGISGTADDLQGMNLTSATQALGLSADRVAALGTTIAFRDNSVFRIISKGWVGKKTMTITIVARYEEDGRLTYLSRTEE